MVKELEDMSNRSRIAFNVEATRSTITESLCDWIRGDCNLGFAMGHIISSCVSTGILLEKLKDQIPQYDIYPAWDRMADEFNDIYRKMSEHVFISVHEVHQRGKREAESMDELKKLMEGNRNDQSC